MAWSMVYYFEAYVGCGLRRLHIDREKALTQIRREVGYDNVKILRKATEKDLAWVEAMGGWKPR